MDPKLTELSQLFERFKAAMTRGDFDSCSNFLSQLKVYTHTHTHLTVSIDMYIVALYVVFKL